MKPDVQKEHLWLQRLVGQWTVDAECVMGPTTPPEKSKGSDSVRSLGDAWVICHMCTEMSGVEGVSIMTLGYDPTRQKFVGTSVTSCMTHLWIYDGTLDEAANRLTLETEGPGFSPEQKLAKYRDVIEFQNAAHRTLTSQAQGEDGQYRTFMTAHYRRMT